MTEKERRLTAYHEAGHALVKRLMPNQDPVHQVSIIPRGRMGGYTLALPKEDKYYTSKSSMLDDIVSLLGGRVAEKVALDDISTGASNDLERATSIARNMVKKYGMSEELGSMTFASANEEVFLGKEYGHTRDYSEEIAAKLMPKSKIIDSAYERCTKLISDNKDKLDEIAELLLEKETIDAEEFEAVFTGKKEENNKKEEEQPSQIEQETVSDKKEDTNKKESQENNQG